MLIFEELQARGHESLMLIQHPLTGLRAILAVHSTVLGPAMAAVRLQQTDEDDMVHAALDLSESLTLKSALAGLNYGGGACIILRPDGLDLGGVAAPHAREALFRALGRELYPLQRRVVLTEDIGVTARDIAFVAQETPGTLGRQTDTSRITGYGVYRGMKAAAKYALNGESLRGVRIAVAGLGAMGRELAEHLCREGARLILADARPKVVAEALQEFEGSQAVPMEEILDTPCDIFAPCGAGGTIPTSAVPRLQCQLIAGGEHYPLTRGGEVAVREAGIMYIPGFAINAAGLIAASGDLSKEVAAEQVYQTVLRVCEVAEQSGKSPYQVARYMAEQRIALIGALGRSQP